MSAPHNIRIFVYYFFRTSLIAILSPRELRDLKHRVQAAREERDTLNAEQQQLLKEKSKLELTIKVTDLLLFYAIKAPF